jgi:hypothetical protein
MKVTSGALPPPHDEVAVFIAPAVVPLIVSGASDDRGVPQAGGVVLDAVAVLGGVAVAEFVGAGLLVGGTGVFVGGTNVLVGGTGVLVGPVKAPLICRVKLPLETPKPSTTITTVWPAPRLTFTCDCRTPPVSSLQASCVPVHVPLRTYRMVSKLEPNVSILYTPAAGAV